jgi:hypothetical protein
MSKWRVKLILRTCLAAVPNGMLCPRRLSGTMVWIPETKTPKGWTMPATFVDGGIRFLYPDNWSLEREDNEAGWTVSLHSPGTAFMVVVFRSDMPPTTDLADAALEALREDYPELEVEDSVESVAGQPAVGHDMRFFSLDLTNTCWTRSFCSPQGTILVLCQACDLEPDKNETVLRAICASLRVDAE